MIDLWQADFVQIVRGKRSSHSVPALSKMIKHKTDMECYFCAQLNSFYVAKYLTYWKIPTIPHSGEKYFVVRARCNPAAGNLYPEYPNIRQYDASRACTGASASA